MNYGVRRNDGAHYADHVKRSPAAMQVSPHFATAVTFSAGYRLWGGKASFSAGCAPAWGRKVGFAFGFWPCPMGISEVREESVSGANGLPSPSSPVTRRPTSQITMSCLSCTFLASRRVDALLPHSLLAAAVLFLQSSAACRSCFSQFLCMTLHIPLEMVTFLRNKEGRHVHAPCFAAKRRQWAFC